MNQESLTVDDLPTDDKPIRYIGFAVLCLTVGVFGVWSFLAPIDGSALAPGTVTVKSHRKTVQHLDGGIVKKLIAKEGDQVNVDDDLLILDDTQIKAELEIIKSQLATLLTLESRLLSERDGKEQVFYSQRLKQMDDHRLVEMKAGQEQIFAARKSSHQGEISVLKKRISQLQATIRGLRGQQQSKRVLAASYKEEIADLKELLAEGFADKQRLRDMQRSNAQIDGEIAELTSSIAGSEIQIGETRLQILQLKKQFLEEVVNQLSETQSKLYDLSERMIAIQDKLDRTEIKSPAQGTVLGLAVHTEGGVIMPGTPILDIVPDDEELVIDARVSPLDIDRVHIGLTAEVRFSAFKQGITPVVEGKVINLSADSLIDEQSGMSYYKAKVELTPESIQEMAELELLPGMPAEVLINTGERTLFEYLTQPVTDAFARAFIED